MQNINDIKEYINNINDIKEQHYPLIDSISLNSFHIKKQSNIHRMFYITTLSNLHGPKSGFNVRVCPLSRCSS